MTNILIPQHTTNLCLELTAEEMRAGAVGPSVDALMTISDSPQYATQLVHGLSLSVSGFFEDCSELPMNPMARLYFQALHAQWPYWMHFLSPDPKQWAVILLCLLSSTRKTTSVGTTRSYTCSAGEFNDLVTSMAASMHHYHDFLGLDDETNARILFGSLRAIDECFPESP